MTIKSTIFKKFEIFLTQPYISLFMPTHMMMTFAEYTLYIFYKKYISGELQYPSPYYSDMILCRTMNSTCLFCTIGSKHFCFFETCMDSFNIRLENTKHFM